MTNKPSTNQNSIMANQTSILNDIELDAVVGGSFLSAVKSAVIAGAQSTPLPFLTGGGPRR